ncbi:hypothetical protein NSTC745_04293 [Nostoc sp. DSM 114161]|jgi:hypothetical protein
MFKNFKTAKVSIFILTFVRFAYFIKLRLLVKVFITWESVNPENLIFKLRGRPFYQKMAI